MRLLLSDGTSIPVNEYTEGSVSIEGYPRRTVTFTMISTTLEEVNAWFEDASKLLMIHLYSDDNDLINDYNGYQYRVSTAIINTDDGKYAVTLAETSDTAEQVRAIQNAVNQNTETVRKMEDFCVKSERNIATLSDNLQEYGKSLDSIHEALTTLQTKTAEQDRKISSAESIMQTTTDSNNRIKERLNEIKSIFQNINSTYQVMVDDLATTKLTAAETAGLARSAKEGLNIMQSDVSGHGRSIMGLTQSTERLEAAHTEQLEDIEGIRSSLTDQSTVLSNVHETVDSMKQTQKTLEETAGNLVERVTNLEPVTDVTKMSLNDAKTFRVMESQITLAEYLESHPILSSCHGEEASYSITKEKQGYLQAMILTTQMAMQADIEYHPSWNATGKPCTYDWTLEQLQQLAFEIESVVRPLVSRQQEIETEIMAAKSIEEITAIQIYYGDEPPVQEEPDKTPVINYPDSLDPNEESFDL